MNQLVNLGSHYDYLSGVASNILRLTVEIKYSYEHLLKMNDEYDIHFKKYQEQLAGKVATFKQVDIDFDYWKNQNTPSTKFEQLLFAQIEQLLVHSTEFVDPVDAHAKSLQKKRKPREKTKKLVIEDVLEILDGEHPDYTFVRNEILGVHPRSMCYEYSNRFFFSDKTGVNFYIEFTSDSDIEDREGRERFEEIINNEEYDDQKFHTYTVK